MKSNIVTYVSAVHIYLALMISAFRLSAGEMRQSLQFNSDELKLESVFAPDSTEYTKIIMTDCDYLDAPGFPAIPYRPMYFLVPAYCKDFKVSMNYLTSNDVREYSCPLYPIQEQRAIEENMGDKFTYPIEPFIDQTTSAKIGGDFIVNGNQHIVTVLVPAVEVNNEKNLIRSMISADILLSYTECSSTEVGYRIIDSPETFLDQELSFCVTNKSSNEKIGPLQDPKSTDEYYYILVPEYLKASVDDLVALKRQKGYKVIVKTIEDIINNSEYAILDGRQAVDAEEKIRNWLIAEKKKYGTFYFLIVGDEMANAPIRKIYHNLPSSSQPYDSEYNGSNFVPTDLYFSDLTTTYNLSKLDNGYYSTPLRGLRYSGLLPMGRLLSHTPNQVSNYIRKLRIYELDPGLGDIEYLNNGLVSLQYDTRRNKSLFASASEIWNIKYLKDKLIDNYSPELNTFNTNKPTGAETIAEMSNSAVISLHGHGSPLTIACSGKSIEDKENPQNNRDHHCYRYIVSQSQYGYSDTNHFNQEIGNGLDNMNNKNKPSFLYSISCDILPFDNWKPSYWTYEDGLLNIGAAFTVGGSYGGIAVIGNTRQGYIDSSDEIEQYFGREIAEGKSLGIAMCNSGTSYSARYSGSHSLFTRALIGDPSINLWLGKPNSNNIRGEAIGTNYLMEGDELKNSKVVLYDGVNDPETFRLGSLTSFSYSITLSSSGDSNVIDNDRLISVYNTNVFPFSQLVADRSNISGKTKKYVLTQMELKNIFYNNQPCFNVLTNGYLNLVFTRGIKTRNSFVVHKNGRISIESYSQCVTLNGDVIKNGGLVEIASPEVILGAGFSVEKGGKLNIQTL